ncbi:MAG: FtsQ-type POTRA domain-containing protein [Propionibacteriaceae bacterium]|jgi:cell division protein FtsQ|nr:FtsQ-type POTRA domain-containing protein [Propionibacteriaceae bacterium]
MASTTRSSQVSDATAKINRRRRKARRSTFAKIAMIVGILLVTSAIIWMVWFSPLLVSRSVSVQGNAQVTREDILDAAQVEMGVPLVRLDVSQIRERIVQLPGITQVEVHRSPTGVVSLVITEAVPAYVIGLSSGYLLVSDQGVGYMTVTERGELPLVDIIHDDSDLSARLMGDAGVISVNLPESVVSAMTKMSATTPDTFTIYLSDGRQILWGSCEDSPLKAEVIVGLLGVSASYYDISSPSHPATR